MFYSLELPRRSLQLFACGLRKQSLYLSGGTGMPPNPYLFKGGIQDRGSGLVKFGLRWYDPTTGRWTQQDTLDTPLDPANANRYMFAGGDPINGIDPGGYLTGAQIGCGIAFAAVATVFGIFAGAVTGGIAAGFATVAVAEGIGVATGEVAGLGASVAGVFACG